MAYPAILAVQALRLPRLNDVSTDMVDPPPSRARAGRSTRGAAIRRRAAGQRAAQQQAAYPASQPMVLELTPQETFALVQKAAQQRGWQMIETAPPGGRTGVGRIEAIDRSLVMRFPDDVTVRIRPLADRRAGRHAVRLAPRQHDFGDNARRVAGLRAGAARTRRARTERG